MVVCNHEVMQQILGLPLLHVLRENFLDCLSEGVSSPHTVKFCQSGFPAVDESSLPLVILGKANGKDTTQSVTLLPISNTFKQLLTLASLGGLDGLPKQLESLAFLGGLAG